MPQNNKGPDPESEPNPPDNLRRDERDLSREEGDRLYKTIGLILGPIVFIAVLLMPTPTGMTEGAKMVAAVTAFTAVWWITEAIPIPAASLLPLILLPLLGAMDFDVTGAQYAHPLIFLFLGGFILAQGLTKWNLHKRIALTIIKVVGTKPHRIILGFMIASAFLSMWISNTATAVMMMPMGIAVADLAVREREDEESLKFVIGLMLGIAFGCTIGGIGTLIGTPPNALFAANIANYPGAPEITFFSWFKIGLPLVIIFLPITWYILTHIVYPSKMDELPGGMSYVKREISELGEMNKGEKLTSMVFSVVAVLWLTRPIIADYLIPGINDSIIALAGATVLFVIPVNLSKREFLLDWEHAVKIPWGVLLLFGGGLAIAKGFMDTGLAEYIGEGLTWLEFLPIPMLILAISLFTAFLSEVTSNTASVALLLPIMVAISMVMSIHPMLLMLTVTISGSLVFILPVGTPPNAIVFASKRLTVPAMARAGLPIKIVLILLFTVLMYLVILPLMGIDPNSVPDWANGV